MQNQNDKINEEWNEPSLGEGILDESELDQVSGGGHGHGHGHGNNGKGNSNPGNSGGITTVLGDGSVRTVSPTTSITDGTSNTISFGEKK